MGFPNLVAIAFASSYPSLVDKVAPLFLHQHFVIEVDCGI